MIIKRRGSPKTELERYSPRPTAVYANGQSAGAIARTSVSSYERRRASVNPPETLAEGITPLFPYALDNQVVSVPTGPLTRQQLSSIGSYVWFSEVNKQNAIIAVRGARAAAAAGRIDYLTFSLSALVELYELDRATHAGALLNGAMPIRSTEIPKAPPGSRDFFIEDHWESPYVQDIRPLQHWQTDMPFRVLNPVVMLMEQAPPDGMFIISFHKRQVSSPVDDPYIYAKYGNWYIQVAQWD